MGLSGLRQRKLFQRQSGQCRPFQRKSLITGWGLNERGATWRLRREDLCSNDDVIFFARLCFENKLQKETFYCFPLLGISKQQQEDIAVSPQYWARAAASKVVEQQASPKISNFPF